MSNGKFINLYVYSDSLGFRRIGQSQDMSFTYPFLLKELIETRLSLKVNLLLRGGGAANIKHIRETIERDSGYFGGDDQASGDGQVLNIAILQIGIVDCAPLPITYLLAPILRKFPVVGSKILAKLVKHRRGIQSLCSYTVTSKRRFKKEYAAIVYICHGRLIRPIAVGLPLPPVFMEQRSPGFRRNASIYNQLIRDVIPESFCDIEQQMTESARELIFLPDGHHLTEAGHRLYAENLFNTLQKQL